MKNQLAKTTPTTKKKKKGKNARKAEDSIQGKSIFSAMKSILRKIFKSPFFKIVGSKKLVESTG